VLCIAGLLTGLFFWRTRRIRLEEAGKALVSRQMAELEMKALRAQMNPHFMFNSLNSIKNYIFRAEPKRAAQYLSNFAHLIRLTLDHSREKRITLKQELDALLLYIELEQMRFENRFELVFDVPETLDLRRLYTPPLLLQPFVENAIWHGLMHKEGKGHLRISLSKCNGAINCIIEDDGVGRTRAGEIKKRNHSKYQSMGISIMEDRIEIINKLEMLQIRIEIHDKLDDLGKPAGTRVNIRIPEISEV
jgi:LytS/YehU family sensor histidine kinase